MKAIEPFENLDELSEFFKKLGINNFSVNIEEEEIREWAEKAAKAPHNQRTPGKLDRDFYERLYKKIKGMDE